MEQFNLQCLLQEQFQSARRSHIYSSDGLKGRTSISCFGFPNIGQSCYMNSCLQSLLILEDFVKDISCREALWSLVSQAHVMRKFLAIKDIHTSADPWTKFGRLHSFREAVSIQAPEFRDRQQKDAHEFLTTVLDQIRSLRPLLQEVENYLGGSYTCPVERHLVFKMDKIRTCKRCGAQSKRQEKFLSLSLDLVPGGSLEDMLEEYLSEKELEYKCDCGWTTSGQMSAFDTLPGVLILHIKRFRLTSSYQLVKVNDPVLLARELVVPSNQGGGCFTLISIISHFGSTTDSGHYICDGAHPGDCPDRWLTFNDEVVTESDGTSVCEQRQDSAYILFYKRKAACCAR